MSIDLTPRSDLARLDVEVRLVGPRAGDVRELSIARSWAETRGAEALDAVEVSDAIGALPVLRDEVGSDLVLRLTRAAAGGDLRLRYHARGAGADASRLALHVTADRAAGVGHAFLLLPRLDAPITVALRFHLGALGRASTAVTSFGVGPDESTNAASEELAHAVYLAGLIDVAERDVHEDAPPSRVAILGQTRLSPLAVLAFSTRAAQATSAPFAAADAGAPPPFSLLLAAEPGLGRTHEAAFLDRSLGIWFSGDRAFDAQMKIVIAHELLHRWVGSGVRIRDAGGSDATWFSEGFTAHYARRTLFDAGLVDQAAFLDDLRRTTSDGAAADPREYAERRGALFAASLDAAIRRRSTGARSLDDVMRALAAASRSAPGDALPLGVLRDLLVAELGASGGDDLDRFTDPSAEAAIDLPSDAFGPCFEKVAVHESFYELGFDRQSLDGIPAVLRRLVVGSAADKAGLREGAIVLKAKVPLLADTTHEVDLTIADRRGTKRIRYRPEGARVVTRWQPRDCR